MNVFPLPITSFCEYRGFLHAVMLIGPYFQNDNEGKGIFRFLLKR